MGGTRIATDITFEEVKGLAFAMTCKNAAALLPYGGAKSGLVGDPRALAAFPALKREYLRRFAEALWNIPDYIPGPDMGTNEEDMQTIYDAFSECHGSENHGRGGVGRPPDKGGFPLDEWGITAHGLLAAAKGAERHLGIRIEGAKVVVQGLGNVGWAIAQKLHAKGAMLVGVSDIDCALYQPKGLVIEELEAARASLLGLASYSGPLAFQFGPGEVDRLLEVPCDLLVPAARPYAINAENVRKIRARAILQGANNPVGPVCEQYLKDCGQCVNLSDFIVNAGGIIACAVEHRADIDRAFRERVRAAGADGRTFLENLVERVVGKNVDETFGRLAANPRAAKTWRDAAMELVLERTTDSVSEVLPELA
jgi:glutamate dehydrogenase/leucine dehydrogenase